MKVFFIINSLSYASGIERVACNLANAFALKLGYQVCIITRDSAGTVPAFELNPVVQVLNLKKNYFSFIKAIQEELNSNSPDYVIIHNMGRLSLLMSLIKMNVNTKLFSLEHMPFIKRNKWIRFASKIFYNKLDGIITLTQKDAASYNEFFDKKVTTIPNFSPFKINSERKIPSDKKIIAIGRLHYEKNFQALLSAWHLIHHKIPDWKLEIYGDGEDRDNLEQFILEHNLTSVTLMGECKNIENVYHNARFYVMSSRFEGLPMVLIEAQSFGLPVISFNCLYGPSEIIDNGYNGILVEDQNIHQLADEILRLSNSPELLQYLSDNSLKNAEKFQEDCIIDKWKNLLDK